MGSCCANTKNLDFPPFSQLGRVTGIRLKAQTAKYGTRGMKRHENFTKTLPFLYQKFVFGHLSVPRCSLERAKVRPWARGLMARSILSV
jgi:hypothetical protein